MITKIPESWREALARVQGGGFHEAVIAGGCLRDLDHNMLGEVKDVDIFVRQCIDDDFTEALLKVLGEPLHVFSRTDEGAKEYFDWNHITFVAHYALNSPGGRAACELGFCEAGPHIDVIAMDLVAPEPLSWGDVVTNDFDLGINRIYFDGEKVVRTAAYLVDCEQKTMTCLRCRNEFELERIKARVKRLRRFKYSNYQPRAIEVKS